ncbi:MAG: CRISPR-associated ring nuclease Csm6 [bacterium]
MKNILLAVCGLNPQIVTESLYALHQEGQKVDALYIITTRDGKEMINAHLLSPKDGHFYRYMRDYQIENGSIAFDPSHVHVVRHEDGHEINDIIDEDDSESFLKKCLEIAFELTADSHNAVFFLVAGGRKTMSSCLAVAAQMYGRTQDRMYHVLVSPEFEQSRDFYYPPPFPVELELKDNDGKKYMMKSSYAKITLVPIPFISIRDRLSEEKLREPQDPATLMLSCIHDKKSTLTLDIPEKKVFFKGKETDLPPALFALYSFFILQKAECTRKVTSCHTCQHCYMDIQEIFSRQSRISYIYDQITSTYHVHIERKKSRIYDIDYETFNQYKAKIRRKLLQAFGLHLLPRLEITSWGARPDTRYGIILDKKYITCVK